MKTKKYSEKQLEQLKRIQDDKNKDIIEKFIIDQADSKLKNKFSDKEIDFEHEKRKLFKSVELWELNNLSSKVLKEPAEHEKIFPQEFYQQIFRLNNWNYEGTISVKPWITGKFTNEIIYFRFSNEVLPFLRIINPYVIPGVRKFKHHQYLTKGSRLKLVQFINQAIELMKQSSDWYDFRQKYYDRYNVPYQVKMIIPKA
ncbi:P63C domain-containing protein [Mesonia sp.]|uniref:P63C domain-containing protein n=1 Tax=Mesonia sp. TaxID=1960830 RepID=UPI00176E48D0|nr:P63C domain-containing protein [Mesonia sp.]HIB37960.1 hypothetical protein [Mesonia sp.]HIO26594.1 hypothetical protein [Flavobacteriaceae bacterium]